MSAAAGYLACAWAILFAAANVYWGLGGAWRSGSPTRRPRSATPCSSASTGWLWG
jgi:hypothetical protein